MTTTLDWDSNVTINSETIVDARVKKMLEPQKGIDHFVTSKKVLNPFYHKNIFDDKAFLIKWT